MKQPVFKNRWEIRNENCEWCDFHDKPRITVLEKADTLDEAIKRAKEIGKNDPVAHNTVVYDTQGIGVNVYDNNRNDDVRDHKYFGMSLKEQEKRYGYKSGK